MVNKPKKWIQWVIKTRGPEDETESWGEDQGIFKPQMHEGWANRKVVWIWWQLLLSILALRAPYCVMLMWLDALRTWG